MDGLPLAANDGPDDGSVLGDDDGSVLGLPLGTPEVAEDGRTLGFDIGKFVIIGAIDGE